MTVDKSLDLNECVEIFEEGVSYLRDVQHRENIDDFSIYTSFQKPATKLLQKYIERTGETEAPALKTLDEVLDMFIANGVIHNYHFYVAAKHDLSMKQYNKVLTHWVKYLECSTSANLNDKIDIRFGFLQDMDKHYNRYVIRDLTFVAYSLCAIKGEFEFAMDDLKSLLQMEELPPARKVVDLLYRLGFSRDLGSDMSMFNDFTRQVAKENININGVLFLKKIDEAVTLRDLNSLNALYSQTNTKSVSQKTLYKLMTAFYELEHFSTIFKLFQDMVTNNVPLNRPIWDLIIKSMGHSSTVVTLSETKKKELSTSIEKLIHTMISDGISVDSRILSSIVASFANLNDFEKVDKYLSEYKSVPTTHALKNNYMVGLILNDQVKQAEDKLRSYMEEDSTFKPSTTVVNTLLNYYSKQQNLPAVNGIIKFMNEKMIPENIVTMTIVTDLYFKVNMKNNQLPNVKEILSLFKNAAVKLNYHTYSVIIDGLVKVLNIVAARAIYQHLKDTDFKASRSPQIITSMMKGELESGSISEAEGLFEEYLKKIRNTTRIWNLMLNSLLDRNEERLALQYYEKFKQQTVNSVYPNFFTYYFLINHFMRRHNKEVVELLLQDLEAANLPNLGRELPKMLKTLSSSYNIPPKLRQNL